MLHITTGLSTIPTRYREVEPDIELAARMLGGIDLHIVGSVGTGKSTLACAILRGAVELKPDATVAYISAGDFEWMRSDDHVVQRQLEELFDVDVLAIDGIDIGLYSYGGYETLCRVLKRRYPVTKHTVTTSFCNRDDLVARISRRCGDDLAMVITNRINELSEVIRLHGPDRRLPN